MYFAHFCFYYSNSVVFSALRNLGNSSGSEPTKAIRMQKVQQIRFYKQSNIRWQRKSCWSLSRNMDTASSRLEVLPCILNRKNNLISSFIVIFFSQCSILTHINLFLLFAFAPNICYLLLILKSREARYAFHYITNVYIIYKQIILDSIFSFKITQKFALCLPNFKINSKSI